MSMINITIDGHTLQVEQGTTILEAARKVNIEIPTLCYMHLKDLNIEHKPGGCRMCVVEVAGRRNLAPACVTKCYEGMDIKTHTMRVLNSRKTVLELILSDHPFDCLVCAKNGHCDLQKMAQNLGIREIHYQGEQSEYKEDKSPAIIREMNKCIMCRRCETMCNDVQTCGVLSGINRGFMAVVAPAFEQDLEKSPCTFCGQCVAVCPTGALTEVDHTNKVIRALADQTKTVIVQTAPAVRVALGEEFGMAP
ncbi:MAG: (2Fe-2S)-binding protein, partial [Bacteroidales bacterium]|nr:(2Fe-2S)-binding protein [Bacteroidales bacterium]